MVAWLLIKIAMQLLLVSAELVSRRESLCRFSPDRPVGGSPLFAFHQVDPGGRLFPVVACMPGPMLVGGRQVLTYWLSIVGFAALLHAVRGLITFNGYTLQCLGLAVLLVVVNTIGVLF